MTSPQATLEQALQHHRAGRFADAARCYHGLLTSDPNDAAALHLFGVLHHENGYHARAVELIGQALALRPGVAAYHANLAEAHRALGQHEQAIACCHTALRLQADFPEAVNNLGLALHDLGRYAEAVEQFHAALSLRPGLALAQNNLGLSLRELGQRQEALEAFRMAVTLDPNLALAQSNLGQLLVDQGQAEQGLPHCQQAVGLTPNVPAAHNNLGNAFRALQRWDEARAAYTEALRLASGEGQRPELPARIHVNLGFSLQLEHKHAESLSCFHRAAELAPDDAEMWQILADAHEAAEDHAAALPCRERVARLRPMQAQAHSNLGQALQDVGRLSEAAICYRRALELEPSSIEALLNQGGLHEELGELALAESCYRRAQAIRPRAPGPLNRLAILLRGQLPETDRQALRERLEDAWLAPGPRSGLLFGLAHVHDAHREYAEAAACLAQANSLALEQRRQRGQGYDPAQHSGLVDRIVAGFTPELFSRLAGAGDSDRQMVFVFGLPRSGTTLVEQVLASHSHVHGAGELRLARQAFESVPAVLGLPDTMATCLDALDVVAVRKLCDNYRKERNALVGVSRERIVDKMPDNYQYLGLLALLFPNATFLHVRRDLRDVAVSCWMTNFRSIRWANDPEHLASRFHQHQRLMAHWRRVLPVPVHEITYARLIDDFDTEARRLLSACGLEWEPACADFHHTTRPVRTASVLQVRQPLYRRSLARWKHYETLLEELFGRLPSNDAD